MVVIKDIKEPLIRPYEIQRRVWEDVHWFKAWYRGMKPKWSEWKQFISSNNLDKAFKIESVLNEQKVYLKYKAEYRLVKNELKT